MSHCKEQYSADAENPESNLSAPHSLHQNTILAMSNLLNANIDTGLMYAIGKSETDPGFFKKGLTDLSRFQILNILYNEGTNTVCIFKMPMSNLINIYY